MALRTAIVVDSWELFRLGVEQVLSSFDVRVVSSTNRGRESLATVRSEHVDLYIVGRASDLKQLEALREVKKVKKALKALVFVDQVESADVARLLSLGVDALLLRTAGGEELSDALERLYEDERVIAPALASGMLGRVGPPSAGESKTTDSTGLSPKELEVLAVLAEGATYKEIAEALIVTQATVKTHLVHIYAKLGAKNREQAVARALSLGLLG